MKIRLMVNSITYENDYAVIITKKGNIKIDKDDVELLSKFNWYIETTGYARTRIGNKLVYLHRLLLGFPHMSDHINRNRLDNRKNNLRIVTNQQNSCNYAGHSNTTSKFKGVSYDKVKKKWHAKIKNKHIGYFATEEMAALGYDLMATSVFGEFAYVNFKEPQNESS